MSDFDFCNALPVRARVGSSTITAIYYYYYYCYYYYYYYYYYYPDDELIGCCLFVGSFRRTALPPSNDQQRHHLRTEHQLNLWLLEAKNVPPKHRFDQSFTPSVLFQSFFVCHCLVCARMLYYCNMVR